MSAKVIAIKSTPAAAKSAKQGTVELSAKERKEQLSAARDAAQARPVTELVEEFHLSDAGATAANGNAEKLMSMLEAAKVEASNYRVIRARLAFQIATHPAVATKRSPVNILGAARVIVAAPGMDEAQVKKAAESFRTTLQHSVKAGEALDAKGMAYLTGTPMEAERAVVERSLDATLRAKSAKNNAKTKAKVDAAKSAAKSPAGDSAELPDGITPAELLKAAKAVLTMATGYVEAGGEFNLGQADAMADVLAEIEAAVAGAVAE